MFCKTEQAVCARALLGSPLKRTSGSIFPSTAPDLPDSASGNSNMQIKTSTELWWNDTDRGKPWYSEKPVLVPLCSP